MKGFFIFLFTLVVVFSFTACTQSRKLIKQAEGYYGVRLPGNIPVDVNGRPFKIRADTIITVYVETTSNNIEWENARKADQFFKILATLLTDSSINIGIDSNNNPRRISRSTSKGYLWRLDLSPAEAQPGLFPEKVQEKLIIGYKIKDKRFTHPVDSFTQLQMPASV